MRPRVKVAIGAGVVALALGALFSVHAMAGGGEATKDSQSAALTATPVDARAPAVSAVCAPAHPDCADITVGPELTCEEADVCAAPSIDNATPAACGPDVVCSNAPSHCPPKVSIEACYPAALPAGPYVCGGGPAGATPASCRPPACAFPDSPDGVPDTAKPPICEPYPCEPQPFAEGVAVCEPYPCGPQPLADGVQVCDPTPYACPPYEGVTPDGTQPALPCPPPPAPVPPECATSSDGPVVCPTVPPPDGGGGVEPSGTGIAESATVTAGGASR